MRSNPTYAMFTSKENPQRMVGIQNDHPYQPVLSRIGIAVIPAARLVTLEKAFSMPNAKASPEAPNQ